MLIASSPVEIEALSDEAGLSTQAHDAALQLFHLATDRIGQATMTLGSPIEDWPQHRFYFGEEDGELVALLGRLERRPEMIDVTDDLPGDTASLPGGLYVRQAQARFTGVLVAHSDHEAYHADD